jgi:hypothetical protein
MYGLFGKFLLDLAKIPGRRNSQYPPLGKRIEIKPVVDPVGTSHNPIRDWDFFLDRNTVNPGNLCAPGSIRLRLPRLLDPGRFWSACFLGHGHSY